MYEDKSDGHAIFRNRDNGQYYSSATLRKEFIRLKEDDDARAPEPVVFFAYPLSGGREVAIELARRGRAQLSTAPTSSVTHIVNDLQGFADQIDADNGAASRAAKKAETRRLSRKNGTAPSHRSKAKPQTKKTKKKAKRVTKVA